MMKLSKKTEYGIWALRYISSLEAGRVATVREIAEQYQIPQQLLAKILQELTKTGIIRSVQGAYGGYVLNLAARDVSLADIVQAIEGPIRLTECEDEEHNCDRAEICDLKETFGPIQKQLVSYFKNITLADLCSVATTL